MDPIERHIKQHFDTKVYSFNETHWLEAQKLIADDKSKRRAWLFWWMGGVVAITFVLFFYWGISSQTTIATENFSDKTHSGELAELVPTEIITQEGSQLESLDNVDENPSESLGSSQSSKSLKNEYISSTSQNLSKNSVGTAKHSGKEGDLSLLENHGSQAQISKNKQQSFNALSNDSKDKAFADESVKTSNQISEVMSPAEIDESKIANLDQLSSNELSSDSTSTIAVEEDQISDLKIEDIATLQVITPSTKGHNFNWGLIAGYLMQKRLSVGKWVNGAYFGARTSWSFSPKWSVGVDLSLVIQEMETVHFHHDVISGYGFGRDSLVTDMYTKRAVTLQIPLAISYAIGNHTFTGVIGTRILLDAQARMQKLHYTNANPENTTSGVVSRSTIVTQKEQLMPYGSLAPFSLYSGLRYGLMIGNGWGLETNMSIPLHHKNARLDTGAAMMAADQGIRLELGVIKVF